MIIYQGVNNIIECESKGFSAVLLKIYDMFLRVSDVVVSGTGVRYTHIG